MNCKKHIKVIEKYDGSLKELAIELGDLHYEVLADFLFDLANKIKKDSLKDRKAGRTKLAIELADASFNILQASWDIDDAWKISKPFMK